MSRRVLYFGFVALSVALLTVSTALAQPNRNAAMRQMQPQPIKTSGTLVSVDQNKGLLQLSTNMNQPMYIRFADQTEISVSGKAEQDYLKPKVVVEFVAEVDAKHTVAEKISHLLVVSLTPDRPVGLLPPDSATHVRKADKGEKGGRAAKPEPDKTNPFGADPLATKPAKGRSSAPQFPGTYTVRGTVMMCRDGKITVSAGRGPTIKAELASDVTIDVVMSDLHAVQRDDKVTVSGITSQAQPNMVMAKSITVELANPLTGVKKHAARPGKTPAVPAGKVKKEPAAEADTLPDATK